MGCQAYYKPFICCIKHEYNQNTRTYRNIILNILYIDLSISFVHGAKMNGDIYGFQDTDDCEKKKSFYW